MRMSGEISLFPQPATSWVDPAIVGLIGAVLGILVSNIATQVIEQRRRSRRTKDLVVAIHAEIKAGRETAAPQTRDAEVQHLNADDMPFGYPDQSDFVFSSIKADVSILPVEVIHAVVRYYKLVEQTNRLTEGFQDPAFAAEPVPSKRMYKTNFIRKMRELNAAADDALADLEAYANQHYQVRLGLRDRMVRRPEGSGSDKRNDGSRLHGNRP